MIEGQCIMLHEGFEMFFSHFCLKFELLFKLVETDCKSCTEPLFSTAL